MNLIFWMILIAVIAAIWWVKNKLSNKKEPYFSWEGDNVVVESKAMVVTIPADAHDAVEEFAKLAHRTRGWIKSMGGLTDEYFSLITIRFTFGSDDFSSTGKFSFDFDWNMERFHKNFGYDLGEGFVVDNDTVTYESNKIENLFIWVGEWKRQQYFDRAYAVELAGAIEATVVNNCPGAYADTKFADETGYYLRFKFK